jgi:hypothetical protein
LKRLNLLVENRTIERLDVLLKIYQEKDSQITYNELIEYLVTWACIQEKVIS